MADNRLELKHIPTGDEFRLARFTFGRGWHISLKTDVEKVAFVDALARWLEEHYTDDMGNHGATYTLDYESGDPAKCEAGTSDFHSSLNLSNGVQKANSLDLFKREVSNA